MRTDRLKRSEGYFHVHTYRIVRSDQRKGWHCSQKNNPKPEIGHQNNCFDGVGIGLVAAIGVRPRKPAMPYCKSTGDSGSTVSCTVPAPKVRKMKA